MSGNPFRRQPQSTPAPAWYSGDSTSIGRISPLPDTVRRSSKAKRVRIQTPPPLSPDSIYEDEDDDSNITRVADEMHEGSPPPDPARVHVEAIEPSVDVQDPFERDDGEDGTFANEEVLENTRRNSATGTADTIDVPVIRNPFHKTLATMEAGVEQGKSPSGLPDYVTTATSSNRSGMDVEAFKRLLLTGKKDSSIAQEPSPAPSNTTVASSYFTGDSNNSDTSPQSRQSPKESAPEDTASAQDVVSSEGGATEQRVSTAPVISKPVKPPPPPRHKHGRSVDQRDQIRQPEVVSFSDFTTTTEPSPVAPRSMPKPVPPPPKQRSTVGPTSAAPLRTSMDRTSDLPSSRPSSPVGIVSLAGPPRAAPPPPLARRTSSKLAQQQGTNHTSSSSDASRSSQTPPKGSKPPPPPPTRRGTKSTSSDPLPSPSPEGVVPTILSETPSRSSSISSHHRTVIPPPPPLRRRGSSKSSLDQPAASSPSPAPASMEEKRISIASLERVAEDVEVRQGKGETVLADMDALQAEIDSLRKQYGR